MIDFEGLPQPADAPEPGACIREEIPEEGIVRLHLDPPHRPKLAVLDLPVLRDLELAIESVRKRQDSVKGLIITGRDPLSFAAGADVDAIGGVEDPALAARLVGAGQELFQKLYRMGRTGGGKILTVAAVGGPVPGGACELSLACDRIVLADDPKTRIGLPEVKLGIYPGWGGTQRLPRRIGLPAALGAILTGRLYKPRQAKKLGIVDRLAHPEYLVRVAEEIALGKKRCKRTERGIWKYLVDLNPIARDIIGRQAKKGVVKQTRGHYPAPLEALDLVVKAPGTPLPAGLDEEARRVAPLIVGPVAKSLVGIFGMTEDAKKLAKLPSGESAEKMSRVGVIGAGVMGGAIASLCAEKGFDARLRDLDQGALDAAVQVHRKDVNKKAKRRRMEKHAAMAAIDRLESTTTGQGFARCDLVVEAVAEKLEIKRAVFGELARSMRPDAILATNTSSLSVSEIAAGVAGPERVVGMHFFNPVKKMPLVEIIRGDVTSDEVVARTAKLALDLGKTPVIVKDVAGFLVNRLLGPYLDEALRLFEEGADPERIDRLLLDFGMPMGPFTLLDEVGLDIASHAAASLFAAYGERMAPSAALEPLVEAGDLGKKSGAGIYRYAKGKRGKLEKRGLNGRLRRNDSNARQHADDEIVDRTILSLVNEAARCLEEEVVSDADVLDLATVFGTGFAPFHGGPMTYAKSRGHTAVRQRLAALRDLASIAARPGGTEKFTPAEFWS